MSTFNFGTNLGPTGGKYFIKIIFKLSNVSNKDALSIRKRLLCSAIKNRNKELQHVLKELSISENFI